jgi:hypothetical protein
MTLTEVEIGDARPAQSPDTKAAIAYPIASSATAITIVEHGGVCSFCVGHKINPHAVSIQWVPSEDGRRRRKRTRRRIVRQARDAGANSDTATAMSALAQAAADQSEHLASLADRQAP